ncbi:11182_t:CDS:2 [Dentiscutata heterogama]|uniref:11182_t:CDS:1 n=1 Tax=Dentiscutata heterogama TaxID=1316150 RepID=A0ACA9L0C3_9GLOM|nr:11182_t:CDS:2 [Dentiscutata heterogama]
MEKFELFANPITRSNSPDSETRSTSAKSNNKNSNMPTIKKTKVWSYFEEKKIIESIQNLDKQKVNIEVTYAICQILNNLDKEHCNIRLKTSSGSTSSLITHLLSAHGITQNRPGLSGPDSDNSKRHQAETALCNKYNKIKSFYKASTSSDKSFSPCEDQDKQERQLQIYQKTFFKIVFIQDTSKKLNDELDNYLSLPEIHYKSDPFNW